MRYRPRIVKLERTVQQTATPELTLILEFDSEEKRREAEEEHAQYEPGPLKMEFVLYPAAEEQQV